MKPTKILFLNRQDAGQQLAQKFAQLKLKNLVVIAIPRGGVVVGHEVAQSLDCPLGITIIKKIFFPLEKNLGFGAITASGEKIVSQYGEGLPPVVAKKQVAKAKNQAQMESKRFKHLTLKLNLKGKNVILVEDTIATGSSMALAIKIIRQQQPASVIAAAPAASESALLLLKPLVDNIVTIYRHSKSSLKPTSCVYRNYPEVPPKKIITILKKYA